MSQMFTNLETKKRKRIWTEGRKYRACQYNLPQVQFRQMGHNKYLQTFLLV